MKTIKFTLITLLAMFAMSQNVNAQAITSNDFNDNGYTVKKGDIVWFGTSLDDAVDMSKTGYVYLYNVKTGKFLNAGGAYGVHAVLSSVGMRLKVAQTTYQYTQYGRTYSATVYTIQGRIDNQIQGDYMSPNGDGNDIYMDRKGEYTTGDQYSRPNWLFYTVNQSGSSIVNGETKTFTNYRIYNYNRESYAGTNGSASNDIVFVNQNGYNNVWRFVSEEDYMAAMDNVTWGSVDLGSFLKDAEFGRDNKDGRYWVWSDAEAPAVIETATDSEGEEYTKDNWDITSSTKHWHQRNQNWMCNGYDLTQNQGSYVEGNSRHYYSITKNQVGSNVASKNYYDQDGFQSAFGQYYAAEIYNEKITLSQTLSMSGVANLKEGLYKMTAQALYYDDVDGTTNTSGTNSEHANAYFFVKTVSVVDGETVEHLQELPIIPMNKVSNSITPHSGVSAGWVFDNNAKAYLHEFYVELKGETQITLGVRTEEAKGWTVVGNVHMYAHGKQALFLDENWTENFELSYFIDNQDGTITEYTQEGDPYENTLFKAGYEFPATVYYTRTMNVGNWTTICLPISLTGDQVRSAFGGDCQLSEFNGLNASGRVLMFSKVDLDKNGMVAGRPYIIKPSRLPDLESGKTIRLEVGNGGATHHVDLKGPVYYIAGVTKDVTSTLTPGEKKVGDITFKGQFYHEPITASMAKSTDYWVLSQGQMYHLQGTRDWNIWATYAYLTAPKSSGAKDFKIMIEDTDEVITSIDGLEFRESDTLAEDDKVYSISGQLANKSSLKKGIYIVNGKKYVVK